jgi:S-(hydroxymethyl)glutathione dehydrogenase / alcohol dehydrogenase
VKTKAAVLVDTNKPLQIWELDVPQLHPGHVLVRVLSAGLCRTQLNEARGWRGEDKYLPHLLGHEASGVVEAVGEGVTKITAGDYVVLSWIKGKGRDVSGGQYRRAGMTVNAGPVAVFTEYAVVSENRVTPISDNVPPDVAALLGCALATGLGIARNRLSFEKGQSLAVFGIGGIGASVVMGAKISGAQTIIAVDTHGEKLVLAKELGATHTYRAGTESVAEKIMADFSQGLDWTVDASGVPAVIEQAFAVLGQTGALVIAGHPPQGSRIRFDPFAFIQGRQVKGTWGGETQPDRDFPLYANWHAKGQLPVEKLVTHRYPLEEINEALSALEAGGLGRAIIQVTLV